MKKVRYFIVKCLAGICNRICPKGAEVTIPPIDGYVASKVGMSLVYTDNMIKRLTADFEGNEREARRYAVEDAKRNITTAIYNAVVKEGYIKFNVSYPKKGEINISGELKVYVPKK